MRLPSLCCALGALVLAGCGGGSVSGETPSGFATVDVHGATLAHPKAWSVAGEERVGDDLQTTLAPGGGAGRVPRIKVSYEATGGRTFDSYPDQYEVVYESVADGKVTSVERIDVDGADAAYLMKAELPPSGAHEERYDVENLQVRRGDATWVVVVERDAADKGALDADAVVSSFRLGGTS